MKAFPTRYPFTFSALLTLTLFGLVYVSVAALPTYVAPSIEGLPAEVLRQPSQSEAALAALRSSENLYYLLAGLLAAALLTGLGWWREAGFGRRPLRVRNKLLLFFPLLVYTLSFAGGVQLPRLALLVPALLGVLLAAFAGEALHRGLFFRVLAPEGVLLATVATALLSGALFFARSAPTAPWPEAVYLSVLTTCAGFTYAAVRWRTASIWPAVLLHAAFGVSAEVSTPETVPFLPSLLILLYTLGFIGYGLLLLRSHRVRADGGFTPKENPLRAR